MVSRKNAGLGAIRVCPHFVLRLHVFVQLAYGHSITLNLKTFLSFFLQLLLLSNSCAKGEIQ